MHHFTNTSGMWEVSERKVKSIDSEIFANLLKEQTFNIFFFVRNVFGRKLWEARFFLQPRNGRQQQMIRLILMQQETLESWRDYFLNTPWRSIYSCHIWNYIVSANSGRKVTTNISFHNHHERPTELTMFVDRLYCFFHHRMRAECKLTHPL